MSKYGRLGISAHGTVNFVGCGKILSLVQYFYINSVFDVVSLS